MICWRQTHALARPVCYNLPERRDVSGASDSSAGCRGRGVDSIRYVIVRSIVWVLLRILYTVLGGIRLEGRANVPRKGGVMVTPNHISDADPPTMGFALPRFCYFMAKEELFQIRIIGPLIRWLHGFPVKRYTADRAALRRAEELLKVGEAVIIFPEGKISEDA